MSHNTVQRHVKRGKEDHRKPSECPLDQVTMLADMQVNFGQTDFYPHDVLARLHYLVCDPLFPSAGLTQTLYSETAEVLGGYLL